MDRVRDAAWANVGSRRVHFAWADAAVHLSVRAKHRRTPWWRDALRRRLLACADAITALLAIAVLASLSSRAVILWALPAIPLWVLLAKLQGLYDRDHRLLRPLTVDDVPRLLVWTFVATLGTIGLLAFTPAPTPPPAAVVAGAITGAAAGLTLRMLARLAWRAVTPQERVLIVGSGAIATASRRKLELLPDVHAKVVDEIPQLDLEQLQNGRLRNVDRIIVASTIDDMLIERLVSICRRRHVKLSVVPPARRVFGSAMQLERVADLPLIDYNTWDVSRSTVALKRALDIAVSAIGLIMLAPVFLATALFIKLDSRGPVFFRQMRAGRNGRPFRMLKFRTMVADAEHQLTSLVQFEELKDPMFKLEHDPRVTRVGRLLRRTSLDELPQLLSVLTGKMSLVGPRPEQVDLVDRYTAEHRIKLAVKPGMTGPMQVYGRGWLTFEERLVVEREYVESLSLGGDLRLLALTLAAVVRGRGAF